jgi:polar amino acid transport system substrate-binding protein
VPWGLAVKPGEKAFADFMSKTVADWHKSGFIQQLEKKWEIKPTKFAEEMRAKQK